MNEDYLSRLGELELEFINEEKSGGSLSLYIVHDPANFSKDESERGEFYAGYDINPEDLDALYYEGLGATRAENIRPGVGENYTEAYLKSFQKSISTYPLIGRIVDVDKNVAYTPDEVLKLHDECRLVQTTRGEVATPKAIRALQKLSLVSSRAAEYQMGLILIPNGFR